MSKSEHSQLTDGVVELGVFTLSDVDHQLAGEDEEHARRFGWHPDRSTKESVRSTILRWQHDWENEGPTRAFAIWRQAQRDLAGGVELRLGADNTAQVSYWVYPAFRGQGLAVRSVLLVCRYAIDNLGVQRVEAHIEPDNHASRKVAAAVGFQLEGEMRAQATLSGERRNMLLMSLLPSDL